MTICEAGVESSAPMATMTFSGLMLFDVGVTTGIVERGRLANPNTQGMYDHASCNTWWTQANTPVKRSVVIGDYVYAVAENVVRVQDVRALGKDLATVFLR